MLRRNFLKLLSLPLITPLVVKAYNLLNKELNQGIRIRGKHDDYQKLKEHIKQYGVVKPILMKNGEVIDGYQRLAAARELNMALPVYVVENNRIFLEYI